MSEPAESKFQVTLDELERSVRVPSDQQVTEQSEPPPPCPLAPDELDRQRLLSITSAGRLRPE